MHSIERLNAAFWNRVAASCDTAAAGLPVLRILTATFLLVWATPFTSWIGNAPPAFFNPPVLSLQALFPGFLPGGIMLALDLLSIALCCAMLLGVKARAATLALVLINVFTRGFLYSFGKIDHDILRWIMLGCMGFSGWGRELAWVPDGSSRLDQRLRGLSLLGVCLAFGMFSAGFYKGVNWIDFDPGTSGFLQWFYKGYFDLGRRELLARLVLSLPPQVFELADYAAVVFELGWFVALLSGPLAWRTWLLVATTFHLVNTLFLNIAFTAHVPLYLAFVGFERARRVLDGWLSRAPVRLGAVIVVLLLGLSHFVLRLTERGGFFLLALDPVRHYQIELWGGLALWLFTFAVLFADLRRRREMGRRPTDMRIDAASL